MSISWFPGHMKKHFDVTTQKIQGFEIVLFVLDARIPKLSINQQLFDIVKQKLIIFIVNKVDLVDQKSLNIWKEKFKLLFPDNNFLFLDNNHKNNWKLIKEKIIYLQSLKNIKFYNRRILVVGIPNCGKSSLINNLCNKKVVPVSNKPGHTQHYQYCKIDNLFEICDTPGLLWPKFKDINDGWRLASINAIRKEILNPEEILFPFFNYLQKNYLNSLKDFFPFFNFDKELSGEHFENFIFECAKINHFLLSSNRLDINRTYDFLLKKMHSGELFLYCLEK